MNQPLLHSNTVLIIDDDPALRGLLSFALESAGYGVLEAQSVEEAIACLEQYAVPVAIVDMGMPPHEHTAEQGLVMLAWLQTHQPQVNALVLTGQNPEITAYLALAAGAFDFLEKPIAITTLLPAVKRACLFYVQAQKLKAQKAQEGVQTLNIEVAEADGVKGARNLAEEKLVRHILADTQFNVHETARRLGIKRENVYYLINKYGLQRQSEL